MSSVCFLYIICVYVWGTFLDLFPLITLTHPLEPTVKTSTFQSCFKQNTQSPSRHNLTVHESFLSVTRHGSFRRSFSGLFQSLTLSGWTPLPRQVSGQSGPPSDTSLFHPVNPVEYLPEIYGRSPQVRSRISVVPRDLQRYLLSIHSPSRNLLVQTIGRPLYSETF